MFRTYGRKAWAVVAYTYDADVHCPDCAARRFALVDNDRVEYFDSEGNPVRPVFSSDFDGFTEPGCGVEGCDECEPVTVCGTCHSEIE